MKGDRKIAELLSEHKIIPVATLHSTSQTKNLVEQLLEQHIHVIEVTLRTPFALEGIEFIKEHYGNQLTIGAGTIIHTHQVDLLAKLQVDFVVSPGLNKNIIESCQSHSIPCLPGVVTPTEIIAGISLGLNTFKFFPAAVFGGIPALKTYAQVFPEVQFCPTGGIDSNMVNAYLDLPNVIAVGGSWMLK